MTNEDVREYIELGKMIDVFQEQGRNLVIEPSDTVDSIKECYFENCLDIEDSEEMTLTLPHVLLEALYKESDERFITVDELVMDIIQQYFNEIESDECGSEKTEEQEEPQYIYLNHGDVIEEGDVVETTSGYCRSVYELEVGKEYRNRYIKVKRKIKKEEPKYRYLELGEVIEEGDEFADLRFDKTPEWNLVPSWYSTEKITVKKDWISTIRRKIK
jgi:hypothetical protein